MKSSQVPSPIVSKPDLLSVKLPYSETGYFSKLICDYLENDTFLSDFHNGFPTLENFESAIQNRTNTNVNRQVLHEALSEQYKQIKNPPKEIDNLLDKNTFTICTGHQLVLATGPLYFIYKIAGIVKTCSELKLKYPKYNFVPVFWLASEDHDFEEANHFYYKNKKFYWESGQSGAVGRMDPSRINQVLDELKEHTGIGYNAAKISAILEKAYLKSKTISEATLKIVHELFGKHGVVVLDGDHPKLKALFAPFAKRELFEEVAFNEITKTGEKLSEKYNLQVTPREINLFYLKDQLRERIVATETGFEVLNSDIQFTKAEILEELENHPERFSPNVTLRPLYQEIILPNLAYVGGGGELAYWFQLKQMFEAFEVPFPFLMLRNSLLYLEKKYAEKLKSLDLSVKDVFQDKNELENQIIKRDASVSLNLENERKIIENTFSEVSAKLSAIERNLEKSVESAKVRTSRIINNLEKKMLRAEKKHQKTSIARLNEVREYLFPNGGLQERRDNLLLLYLIHGENTIDIILNNIEPFDYKFTVLVEE